MRMEKLRRGLQRMSDSVTQGQRVMSAKVPLVSTRLDRPCQTVCSCNIPALFAPRGSASTQDHRVVPYQANRPLICLLPFRPRVG